MPHGAGRMWSATMWIGAESVPKAAKRRRYPSRSGRSPVPRAHEPDRYRHGISQSARWPAAALRPGVVGDAGLEPVTSLRVGQVRHRDCTRLLIRGLRPVVGAVECRLRRRSATTHQDRAAGNGKKRTTHGVPLLRPNPPPIPKRVYATGKAHTVCRLTRALGACAVGFAQRHAGPATSSGTGTAYCAPQSDADEPCGYSRTLTALATTVTRRAHPALTGAARVALRVRVSSGYAGTSPRHAHPPARRGSRATRRVAP